MRWGWLLISLVWSLLIAGWLVWGGGDGRLWTLFTEARFSGASLALLRGVLAIVALHALPYALLGGFCVLACRGRGHADRVGAFPLGLLLGWLLAFLLAGLDTPASWRMPAAIGLVLPLGGCLVGAVLGGAFALPARRMLPSFVWRALLLLAVAGVGVVLLAAAVLGESAPVASPAKITSEEKLALVDELRRHNPLRLDEGEQAAPVLPPRQLEDLLSWGVLLVDDQALAEVRETPGGLAWLASVRMPVALGGRRHLTLGGELALELQAAELRIDRCVFAAGTLQFAPWLCRSLLRSLHGLVSSSGEFGALTAAVEMLRIDGQGLAVRYVRPDLDGKSLSRLQLAFGPGRQVRAAVRAQFDLLRVQGPDLAREHDRFEAVLRAVFELAERRSATASPVAENQGAILVLATILGHHEVATLAGIERPDDWLEIRDTLWPVALRGRADWSRHFLVSAGLTQISAAVVSDAAGLLKEELDAARGTGFSFGDLLADRAGTRFGELAGRDYATARALQSALARGYRADRLMPAADDLSEGLSDAEFQRRYGGVGSPAYQVVIADIEARVRSLPGF